MNARGTQGGSARTILRYETLSGLCTLNNSGFVESYNSSPHFTGDFHGVLVKQMLI